MNVEELLSLVEALSPSWVRPKTRRKRSSRSAEIHSRFVDLARSTAGRKQKPAVLRGALISAINDASIELLSSAQVALEKLHDARLRYEVMDDNNGLSQAQIAAAHVPPFTYAAKVFWMATRARCLEPEAQIWVARWLELRPREEELKADLANCKVFDDFVRVREVELALKESRGALQGFAKHAPSAAKGFVEDIWDRIFPLAWGSWTFPVQLPASATDDDLIHCADLYERLSSAMFRPLPVSLDRSMATMRRWKKGWRDYEECGESFGVIACWLRAMVSVKGPRRCRVCYRHLGQGMKRFCAQHQRISSLRQDSRELNVSRIYAPVLKRRLEHLNPIMTVRGPSEAEVRQMTKWAEASGVCPELTRPAGGLAASLRTLYPFLTAISRECVQSVFSEIVSVAQEPFDCGPGEPAELQILRCAQRNRAHTLFSLASFFRALYASPYSPEGSINQTLGAGLDIHHPFARGEPVPSTKQALDLVHLSVWLEVDDGFDHFAYLNPLYLKRLGDGDPARGIRPMSLAQISRYLGVSAEAVRQTLRHANGHAGMKERRQRVIPTRLAEFEARLLAASTQDTALFTSARERIELL